MFAKVVKLLIYKKKDLIFLLSLFKYLGWESNPHDLAITGF